MLESKVDKIKYLLEKKADPNISDEWCSTPVHNVCSKFYQILDLLLNAKADINFKNSEGKTPLCYAASSNNIELVRYLVYYKSDVNIPDNKGFSPIHYAIQSKEVKVIKLLFSANTNIDLSTVNISKEKSELLNDYAQLHSKCSLMHENNGTCLYLMKAFVLLSNKNDFNGFEKQIILIKIVGDFLKKSQENVIEERLYFSNDIISNRSIMRFVYMCIVDKVSTNFLKAIYLESKPNVSDNQISRN